MALGDCQAGTLLWLNECSSGGLIQPWQFGHNLSRGSGQVARYGFHGGGSCRTFVTFFYFSSMRTLSLGGR